MIQVTAKAWCWSGYASDYLTVFEADSVSAPVWVNRDGADWPAAASPQPLTVRSLAELATLLS